MDKRISVNQFVEFGNAKSEKAKMRIVRQQIVPNPFLIPWYQRAKSSIRKSLRNGGDLSPIYEGIEILMNKVPANKRQLDDKKASISALEKFAAMELPSFISEDKFEVVKLDRKSIEIKGLDISLSPELVFRLKKPNGDSIVGAMNIHICKSKPFSLQTAELASSVLYEFLKSVVGSNERADPRYCFTIDVFGDRIVPVPTTLEDYNKTIDGLCEEIIRYWDAA